ncbi:protein ABHD11-like [Centruroides sculpturatus]|uniref:protein ABHD11-like n=1 Tax=Centruroides sculpturatus TaxID=218467 RepID=UPI000C6E106D|nr:protein ABHD11-like [Centruroides sculpturatus]
MEPNGSKDYVELVSDLYDGTDEEMLVASLSPVVILHGLLDLKENWEKIAKDIADISVRKVYVLDMRNHGDSPKISTMMLEEMVNDVENFLKKINEPVVLIWHSLGGIVAMELAFQKSYLLKELIIIDTTALRIPTMEEELFSYMCSFLRTVLTNITPDSFLKMKSIVENRLKGIIKISSLRKIIMSNLIQVDNQLKLKANIDIIETEIWKSIRKRYPLRGFYGNDTLLIYGSSDYVLYTQLHFQISSLRKIIMSNLIQVDNQLKLKANIDIIETEIWKSIRKRYPLRGFYGNDTLLIYGSSDYVL